MVKNRTLLYIGLGLMGAGFITKKLVETVQLAQPVTPQVKYCHNFSIRPNESLDDVVRFFKRYDPSVSVDVLAKQNDLYVDGKVAVPATGTILVYCYNK
ncbi:hypothetical protein HZC30_07720 [Candidatus Woesearchaeota archaeon]|nr:hypothetical protein [Candidatus Woesearchaeota archaeon]